MDGEHILIGKLNEFIGKFYKNKIIRGALISLSMLISLYLIEILLEYFSYFPSITRIILVYFYLASAFVLIGSLVVFPLFKYLRIGKILTNEQAATIIGEHFSEIGDKLLNTLQLIGQKDQTSENIDLLVASIDQKINRLKPIPFNTAINLRKNVKYLKYTLPPLFILLLLITISPSIVSDPTLRLVRYNRKFSPPALFHIIILNKELKTMQQDDFNLRVEITGEQVPDQLYLKTGNSVFTMKRESHINYSFLFRALQGNTAFTFISNEKESEEHIILVYPRPIILNFETRCDYPSYTGKQSETAGNIGDFLVPEGTRITWNFYTRDVTEVIFKASGKETDLQKHGPNVYSYSNRFLESIKYSIAQKNQFSDKSDSLGYLITVVKDAFPEISIKESKDTTLTGRIFLQGTIKDDYGFTKLLFYLSKQGEGDSILKLVKTENIDIEKNNPSQVYFYALDLSAMEMKPGDKYAYYLEVWDNDGIHGPKSTRTAPQTFELASVEQLARSAESNSENIKKGLNKSLSDTKEIGKTLDEINRRMIDQNDVSWKEKKKLEEVIKTNEEIQKQVSDFRDKNAENLKNESEYLKTSERILEKQKKLNEIASHLLTEEMKKTIQEMKDLLNQMDKSKLNEMLPKMKRLNEDLEKELDRNLQLFKQIEFERKLEQSTNDLKKLAEEQKRLSEKTNEQEKNKSELDNAQKDISQKFDSVNKSLSDLEKQSKELEGSPDLNKTDEKREEIDSKLKLSQELMKAGKMKDASKNQKNTAEEMKELAQQIENMQEESEEEAQEEDSEALKLLLQNLNKLSFQQEDLIYRTVNISRNDPRYLQLVEDQKEIRDKFKNLEDSLSKIAKRQVMMESIIMKEVSAVTENLRLSEKALGDRSLQDANSKQQYAMTAINNLAVLLDEALRQMNEQINNSKNSNGQKACKKPGKPGGKKSMNSMRKMQEEMKSKLEKMKEGLGKGNSGKSGTRKEMEGMNKEVAEMVSEQEAIRQALQEYENALKEQGIKESGDIKSIFDDLEKNEKDILNKRITQETLNRQERIMTRMLESEKAEQNRDKEEQRKSTEAKNQLISNPKENIEYKMKKSTGKDILNFTAAPINFYYKAKASEYLLKISK